MQPKSWCTIKNQGTKDVWLRFGKTTSVLSHAYVPLNVMYTLQTQRIK